MDKALIKKTAVITVTVMAILWLADKLKVRV
jgi:hypothetical protein